MVHAKMLKLLLFLDADLLRILQTATFVPLDAFPKETIEYMKESKLEVHPLYYCSPSLYVLPACKSSIPWMSLYQNFHRASLLHISNFILHAI